MPQPPLVTYTDGCRPGRFRADAATATATAFPTAATATRTIRTGAERGLAHLSLYAIGPKLSGPMFRACSRGGRLQCLLQEGQRRTGREQDGDIAPACRSPARAIAYRPPLGHRPPSDGSDVSDCRIASISFDHPDRRSRRHLFPGEPLSITIDYEAFAAP